MDKFWDDIQQVKPVYHCANCDGEIYPYNHYFRVDTPQGELVLCEDCVTEDIAE